MAENKQIPYDIKRAADSLDWGYVIQSVKSRATSEPGKLRCDYMEFLRETGLVRLALAETSEAKLLLLRGVSMDLGSLTDLGKILSRAKARGVLDALELLRVSDVLKLSRRALGAMEQEKEIAPNLARLASRLFISVELEKKIHTSIDRDGKVLDSASPQLQKLRARYHSTHAQVHDTLYGLMESKKFKNIIQDEFFTLRNGRYVLPVQIEKKGTVEGIVHDISGSGQSIFVEPKEITHLNNTLRTCELEVEQEIYRILAAFSSQVAAVADDIEVTVTALTEIDFIFAKARYSIAVNADEPEINDKGIIALHQVRHPMLVAQGEVVVPNDIILDHNQSAMIITGPNTGGKTVALKCVGICALMVRAGLHIPANPDSKMSVFRRIFALIGDEQSIEQSLSSFSAHILGLKRILDQLVPDSLVLVDEIGEGTDPGQGVALSKAVIERLITGNVRTVITTHFTELTTLAFLGMGVSNASVEFDTARNEPTYRLTMGLPGRSSAFEIADRLGLDRKIIDRARSLAIGADTRLDEVLKGVEAEREKLAEARKAAEEALQRTQQDADKQKELLNEIKAKKQTMVEQERSNITKQFEHAKDQIKKILQELSAMPTFKRIEKARKEVIKVERNVEYVFPKPENQSKEPDNLLPIDDWSALCPDDEVYVRPFKNTGFIEEMPDGKGNVQLVVSGARVTVPADSCFLKRGETKKTAPQKESFYYTSPVADEITGSVSERSCDLRGMSRDEALDEVRQFLDEAMRNRYHLVYLIHGHGTGVLKKEVRDYCRTSPYISNWRPGEKGEGGDGATIVELDLY